jgi:hypothetical protein
MSGIISQSRLGRVDVHQPEDNYLGTTRKFMDKDWSNPDSVELKSGCWITAVYVKNDSGSAIAGGVGVLFQNTALGKEIGGLSGADGRCDGVADPFVTSIPNGSYFWIVIGGPCSVLIGSGGVTQGDAIQTAASGGFITLTDGNTYASGRCGITTETKLATERARVFLNIQHQALIPCC